MSVNQIVVNIEKIVSIKIFIDIVLMNYKLKNSK